MLAWAIGRWQTDRHLWTQYLFWIPTPVYALAAGILAIASHLLSRLATNGRSRRRRRPGALPRIAACSLLAVALWRVLIIEWRAANAVLPARAASPRLRIAYWNATSVQARDFASTLRPLESDLAIVANPTWAWALRRLRFDGQRGELVEAGGLAAVSRYPILRWGLTGLSIPGAAPAAVPGEAGPEWVDPGRALYLELDTTPVLGRPIVVWVIDLPSDWRLSRWRTATMAAERLATWAGGEYIRVEAPAPRAPAGAPDPPESVEEARARMAAVWTPRPARGGFPRPDVIVGDFNIPRGSASLGVIAPGMANAFDQCGWGFAATWPRERPFFHLDQAFVAPGLRARRYVVVEPPEGQHRLQVVDVAPR